MSSLSKFLSLVILPVALASPMQNIRSLLSFGESSKNPSTGRDNSFVWASLGDSWAAGVSYDGDKTDYDGDKNGCHRWKNSYGPIMERNNNWTTGTQEFHFAACSGAILENVAAKPQGANPAQMDLVGSPNMATYHAGGNNCGFGEVVEKCIYQPAFRDWGPKYPDPAGECGKSFNAKNAYIKDAGDFGLYQQEMDTIKDILKHSAVKDNDNFHLYIMGYAQFFNEGDNYCNDISFGALAPVYGPAPKLTNRLRTDLNSAVKSVNDVLARVAKDDHRFCEDKHKGNDWDQWYSTDIWLWNLNFPRYDPPSDPELIQAWLNGSTATNVTAGANVGVEAQGDVETDSGSGGSGGTWMQRPFHPKQGGTNEIADLVMAQAKADKIPGVVGASAPTTGTCDCNENGCSPNSPACCANGSC
ncbi:putative SGNH hydrolase-type esterase domain-containing protein [Seiridium unicorne]|uniref:SGNH hydrolase-type esterase domain-containing protein n=1 Tax=Seiridium unicorne TaxID=138068 RepID=A0ABR2UR45_9PEZI